MHSEGSGICCVSLVERGYRFSSMSDLKCKSSIRRHTRIQDLDISPKKVYP